MSATTSPNRLIAIDLDDSGLPAPTPEIEQERSVALFDLLEANSFGFADARAPEGPYKLRIGLTDGRLALGCTTGNDQPITEFQLSLSPFRDVIRDYFQICAAYFDAVKKLPPAQIEAIDMGRRGIHDEGARLLEERLDGKIVTDKPTARRLFTLICVLHAKG